MTDVCQGGAYDGLPLRGLEDRLSCTGNEGQVTGEPPSGPTIRCSVSTAGPVSAPVSAAASALPLALVSIVLARRWLRPSARRGAFGRCALGLTALAFATSSARAQSLGLTHAESGVRIVAQPVVSDTFSPDPIVSGLIPAPGVSDTLSPDPIAVGLAPVPGVSDTLSPDPRVPREAEDFFHGALAVQRKAQQLGWAGAALGDVEEYAGGYRQSFENADVYYSPATGAHELHGDIREKFAFASPPLGLPTTDETATPDGVGRFNHFTGGSIYWTPNTGPKIVRGAIRDYWASQGWELGPLGYPVADEHHYNPPAGADPRYPSPAGPDTWSSVFQNGAVVARLDPATGRMEVGESSVRLGTALRVSAERIKEFVWRRFDDEIHQSPDNFGFHPGVDVIAVSDWGHSLDHSVRRRVTYRMYGFRDNGWASDTDFDLSVRLRYELNWFPPAGPPQEPAFKSMLVNLEAVQVDAEGWWFPGTIAQGLASGIVGAFKTAKSFAVIPTSDPSSVAAGFAPDFIDYNVTKDGSFDVFINPVPSWVASAYRMPAAERAVEELFGG